MIRSSKKTEISPKQEGTINDGKINEGPSTSRQWLGLKDPRVVRVSRTFGGKDRHSKVTTIRGLRDRRVRLSVPTAIQLYDLQDRLGLNQPSKVVDWLLNASKHAIDELPPLQVPPENFVQYPQSVVVSHEVTPPQIPSPSLMAANSNYVGDSGDQSLTEEKFKSNKIFVGDDQTTSTNFTLWNANASLRAKNKEVTREIMRRNEQGNQESIHVHSIGLSAHTPLPRPLPPSFSGLLNNVLPHPSYYHWEPPNAYLSHSGTHGYSWQAEQLHNNNAILLPPALSLSSGSQLLLCPSGAMPSIFPSYASTQEEDDPKLSIHQSQMLSSSSQSFLSSSLSTSLYSVTPAMRPLQVNITPMHHHSQNNLGSHSISLSKGSGGPSIALTTSSSQNDSKATLGLNPSSFM